MKNIFTVSFLQKPDYSLQGMWKNISKLVACLAVAVFLCLFFTLPSGSEACGWWGDAEHDDDAELVDTEEKPIPKEDVPMGDPEIQTRIGNRFRTGDKVKIDYTEAMYWYRRAAEQGSAGAQNNLANMYEEGLGLPKNEPEAVKWYRRAAEKENANAQHSLGRMYRDGQGISRDLEEAVKWIQRAAEQGHKSAFRDMGEIYWKGLGVSQNDVQAYMWWKLGSMHGDKESAMQRSMAADKMTPKAVAEAEMRAKKWRPKQKP
jgi:TPR repeat protein